MLFKLFWLFVVAWIAYRVWNAGRNIFRIAMGHEQLDRDGSPFPPRQGAPGFGGRSPFGQYGPAGNGRTNQETGRTAAASGSGRSGNPVDPAPVSSRKPVDVEDARFEDL